MHLARPTCPTPNPRRSVSWPKLLMKGFSGRTLVPKLSLGNRVRPECKSSLTRSPNSTITESGQDNIACRRGSRSFRLDVDGLLDHIGPIQAPFPAGAVSLILIPRVNDAI